MGSGLISSLELRDKPLPSGGGFSFARALADRDLTFR